MTLHSMTGFGRAGGTLPDGTPFLWEVKSVNARGLELRLRLPPGWDALEGPLREAAARRLRRGSLQAVLILRRERRAEPRLDPAMLERMLALALEVAARIPGGAPPRAEALLALPGVLRSEVPEPDPEEQAAEQAALIAGFEEALSGLIEARAGEGARLSVILSGLLDEMAALLAEAERAAAAQPAEQRARLLDSLAQLLEPGRIPQERLAQEVALLVSRCDVREELDRLDAHIAAARGLLAEGAGAGRKLDFLVQELVREANTLCSKSASIALTRIGLALKHAIERFREQAANVE
ncbi:MAG: YicC/YloC family endoribonuclease [Rhodovarius sp.]|nr:YicC family protein [Rhodovarius sp.]MDW8315480.1 YicC/YloC family endoribonuclease [Rhodovarius sp.]